MTRRVKPGHEAFYEEFLEGIIASASQFPGHLGVEVFRPQSATAGEYRIVYRFDTAEHLRAGSTPTSTPRGSSAPSRT